ncbi:MAG: hypothetical protein ACFB16_07765 [Phormidesmis sp.]
MRILFQYFLFASALTLPLAVLNPPASAQEEISIDPDVTAQIQGNTSHSQGTASQDIASQDMASQDMAQSCSAAADELPSSEQRIVEIPEWQVSFAIPENYQTFQSGTGVDVLAPSSYAQTQCTFTPNPARNIEPYGVSVALVDGTVTEDEIRAQLSPGEGKYLGPTGMPSGIAHMHTSQDEENHDLVHLSLPVPGQAATIVFTANTDSTGEIFQEDVLEIILDSFEFESDS